jgi:transcriptional repressor NrdR
MHKPGILPEIGCLSGQEIHRRHSPTTGGRHQADREKRKKPNLRCPFCQHIEDRVIDSRLSKEGDMIRRRRECAGCQRRFTTYERVEETVPLVIKKDGRREVFDRNKILSGLHKACEKRPISVDVLEKLVDRIQQRLQDGGEREVLSRVIGEQIMQELQNLDEVAYVRFASVYRSFKDVNEFMNEVKELLEKGKIKKD